MVLEEEPTIDGSGAKDNTVPIEDPRTGASGRSTKAGHKEEDTIALNINRLAQQKGQQSGEAT